MRTLKVAADAFGAEHAAVEGEVFPWLESNDLVIPHFELDATLLAAKAAVSLYQSVRINRGVYALAGWVGL
jgi:hypothetical protein